MNWLNEDLKKERYNLKGLKWHFEDIKRIIKIIEKFIELDDKDIDASHVYSLIMRARILYMIECLLKEVIFGNKGVKNRLLQYDLDEKLFDYYYQIYQKVKNNEEIKENISRDNIERLMGIIKIYLKEVENETEKKAKKRS